MANTESAKKRVRQIATRRLRNRYKLVGARNVVKQFMALKDRAQAEQMWPSVESTLDKLAQKNIIHRNKAANQKSKLRRHLAQLA